MSVCITDVSDLDSMLKYCAAQLNWPIEDDWFEDVDDLVFNYDPDELGIKEEEISKIVSFKQLRPLVDNQPWGIFSVEFDSKRLEVSALRHIVHSLIPRKNSFGGKTWKYNQLLFLCFWGERSTRTVGILGFSENAGGLPVIKTLYCSPRIETRDKLETFESQLSVLAWPKDLSPANWLEKWNLFFIPNKGQVIRNTKELAESLATAALSISTALTSSFAVETENGFAHQLYRRFQNALHISLSQKDFIDMYAQTIVYGLFSARCMHPEVSPFNASVAISCIPETNPLLKDLLEGCCTTNGQMRFDELDITDLINELNQTEINNILNDFNRQTGLGKEDPIVYFYEKFLDLYEKEEKKRRGVYYTPTPAVDFIIRAITALLKEEFDCQTGVLNSKVSILDPATGTGTFLRRIILEAKQEFDALQAADCSWSDYVCNHLLKRVFGFEFMMAPYAVAHMKLAMTLKDTGYDFSASNRLQVYLANALECNESVPCSDAGDSLQVESQSASHVKNSHINVIVGNPPYRTDSVNKDPWIMHLMEDYKHEPGTDLKLQERNPKVINDDYVKFIRFAQETVANEDNAIIGFVVPHSFTDNLTFRGMRWNLMHSFDSIYIFDLHGNVMSRESTNSETRDENIFDIQQGVCIAFFVKKEGKPNKSADIFYADMFGSRDDKYDFLRTKQFGEISWNRVLPEKPYYFFKPKDLSQAGAYNKGIQLSELFPNYLGGIKTHNDEALVSVNAFVTGFDQFYDYRPFDIRHINYDVSKVERNRYDIMKHFIGHENLGLVMDRQVVTDNWSHIQIVRNMVDNRVHYSRKGIPVECPMFLFDDKGTAIPNADEGIIKLFESATGFEFSKELTESTDQFDMLDLFDYCYGVLSSKAYRAKYYSLLSIDFPRVPLPVDAAFFRSVCKIGGSLRMLHVQSASVENALNIKFLGTGDSIVAAPHYSTNRAYINPSQYFTNIREDVWDFCFGGYHGLQKWMKDRRGTKLEQHDIDHVISTYNIFEKSILLMEDADAVLIESGIL